MNQDEIIRTAREAGCDVQDGYVAYCDIDDLKTFAEMVAASAKAEEREACAKLCGDLADSPENSEQYRWGANYCRERILARGNT